MTPHTGPRVALTALLWLCLLPASWAQLKFATSVDPHFARSIAEQVLTQAYQQLGLRVEFVPLPIRRGYAMAATGELDGVTQSVILEPSVEMVLGHHLLNPKHAELIPRLTQVLRKMEADGSIKKAQCG